MKRKFIGVAALLAVAFAALFLASKPAQSAPAIEKKGNLLVNGSFEEGPETDKFLSLDEGSKAIKGWVVTRAQIDLVDAYWTAAEGKRSIDLHGSPGLGGIKQTFATQKGQKYRVTFAYAGNPEGMNPMKKMGVSAAGQKEEFTFDATGKTKEDLGWKTEKWDFKADGKETTLEFYTLMTDDVNCGPVLDNVSVVEID
jgi:choice-of-anchor C domain-containing protein